MKLRLAKVFFVLRCLPGACLAVPSLAVETLACAGDVKSSHALIYLHGVDPKDPTEQEVSNRALLSRLAKTEGIALAMLRSTSPCTQASFRGKLCWPRGTETSINDLWRDMLASARPCHSKNAKVGAIGFSNGGFFLNRLVGLCVDSPVRWFLSIGSAGSGTNGTKGGKACGELHLLIGKKDITNSKAKAFYKELQALGRQVRLQEFDGGHIVPEHETREAMRQFKKGQLGL